MNNQLIMKKSLAAAMAMILSLAILLSVVGSAMAQENRGAAGRNGPAAPSQPKGPSDPVELGAFLDGAFAAQMKTDNVAGAVVTVVEDGQVLYTQGYGYADLEKQIPVDAQKTLFRVGSVSKLFVWTSVMQLVEQGKLSLDADVNTYLDFTIPATYSQPVTMKNLLTHTSGFEDVLQDLITLRIDQLLPLGTYLKTHIPTRVSPPGTVIAYSNFGAATAAYIVERVSGMPFSTYVEKNILQPLGMDHSTFVQPLPETLAADMSKGYNKVNGGYLPGSFELVQAYPAGSMSATAADMARFMIAHLQNGKYKNARILAEATAQQMHSPLYSQDPSLHGMAYGFLETEDHGQRMIMHSGDTLLFHTGLFLLPDQKVGIFISTNSAGGGFTSYNIYKAFMDRYYPVPVQAASPAPADFASRAGKYAGEYYTSRSNYTSLEKMFRLFSPVTITVDKEGNVLLSEAGDETRYTEVEPGRLVASSLFMPVLLLKEDPGGQVTLLNSMPWTLIKTPWYATLGVTALIFGGGLLLFLITLVAWLAAGVFRLLRRGHPSQRQPRGAFLGRVVAALFMLVFVVLVLGLVWVIADIDPAFGVPRLMLRTPPVLDILVKLAPVLGILGVLTLPFVCLAWLKRYWSVLARLFYTLLAAWFWVSLWAMYYWKVM